MDLQLRPFADIDLTDPFFDSLKATYPEFSKWYNKKAAAGEQAYVFYFDDGRVADFLYMKIETDAVEDVEPVLPAKRRLKVGTFKLLSRGTRRGERFMKKIMDRAMAEDVDEVYVTIFPTEELDSLIRLFSKFGFNHQADKIHPNGRHELVMVKDMKNVVGNVLKDYPRIRPVGKRKWLLAIKPKYHTRLFPDSILNNESYDLVQDLTSTNGIYKVYISWIKECAQMRPGDLVVIYRTSDGLGPAKYRSVATSICTVEEVKNWSTPPTNINDYLRYTQYSVFSEEERKEWFRENHGLLVIKMLYNIAFAKRVIRKDLLEQVGLSDSNTQYWGFFELTDDQFRHIARLGNANERYIID